MLTCFPMIFVHYLQVGLVILHMIQITHQCTGIKLANFVKVMLITNIKKSLKMLFDMNLTRSFVHCLHASINQFGDNLMDCLKMVMLSMHKIYTKWIITLHSNYSLISYSLSSRDVMYLTSEMLQLLAIQMFHMLLSF